MADALQLERAGEVHTLLAPSVILCAGGFEANPVLRQKWMGPGWQLAHTRGTPHNTGDMLLEAIRLDAKTVGDFSSSGCHSTAWDADSPQNGGDREKTNEFTKSGYPLGLMLNAEGKRYVLLEIRWRRSMAEAMALCERQPLLDALGTTS